MSNHMTSNGVLPAHADLSDEATVHISRRGLLASSAGLAAAAIGIGGSAGGRTVTRHGYDGRRGTAQRQQPPL